MNCCCFLGKNLKQNNRQQTKNKMNISFRCEIREIIVSKQIILNWDRSEIVNSFEGD